MPAAVQLVAGPARAGKTQRLLAQYQEKLRETAAQGVASAWLAPNQTNVVAVQQSLLTASQTAYLRPNLFTFANFAESIIARSTRLIRPIHTSQKRRLLRQVIRDAKERRQLDHFGRVAATPGFVIQLDEFIGELKRADVWPEAFDEWCQRRPRADRRNRELSLLYAAYQQLLHRGDLYDDEGRFWAARDILTASDERFDLVVVSGFNDFTTAQLDILRLLGERAAELVISLTVDSTSLDAAGGDADGSLLFAKTQRTLAPLREVFPKLETELLAAQPPGDTSLRQLQHDMFRESTTVATTSPTDSAQFQGVEILAASSEVNEIEAVAQRIKSLLHSAAAMPEDIVVVCRGGEAANALIDAAFSDYGLPYWSESRRRLETEPLVRTLLSILRLQSEDWPFETLLDVINNRLFTRFDETDGEAGDFATLPRVAMEYCVRSAQLPAGRKALLEQLEHRHAAALQAQPRETDRRSAQVARSLASLRELDQILANLPTEAALDEWIAVLERMLVELGTTPTSSRAWQQLRRGLRELQRVDAWSQTTQQTFSLEEIRETIQALAGEQRVAAEHDAVGRVRILSAESARKLSTKHLFLTGLGEQAFSETRTTEMDVSTASYSESTELPDELVEPPQQQIGRGDAMLLFYELATRPTASLTLSYPALDTKGQALPPSPLLTDLERSVGEGRIPHHVQSMGHESDASATPFSLGGFRRRAVEQALDGKQRWLAGLVTTPALARTGQSIVSGIDCIAQRGVRDNFGPFEGLMLSKSVQARLSRRFDSQHLWSPSQLEGYAACPFRFFAEHMLGLEPLSELTLSNDARRRGSLLHQVLATVHEELLKEAAGDVGSEELVKRFQRVLDEIVKASPLRGIEQSLREIERREIEAFAPDYAAQETAYRDQWKHLDQPPRPALFEVRFGPETRHSNADLSDQASTVLPFELDLGEEKICLTGQVDRVDIGQVGGVTVFNIIDYKSGKEVRLKHDKVRSGHQLQLPLYALAAEQLLLAEQEAVAMATGYWNIRGNGFVLKKGVSALAVREAAGEQLLVSEAWQEMQPDILSRVQQLIAGVRGGEFPVYNTDDQCTRSCSLSTVCRVAQIRSLEKVWPPEVADDEEGDDGR